MTGASAESPQPETSAASAEEASGYGYEPPALTRLGDLTELTLAGGKTVGLTDGSTFLGLDIGSI